MLPLFLFLCLLPYGNAQEAHPGLTSGLMEYQGNYVNGDYRFSVRIPSGLVGLGAAEYAPNHGFRIDFIDSSDYLLVDGSFDVLEFDDPPIPEGYTALETRRANIKLAGVDAVRLWRRMKRQNTEELYISIDVRTKRNIRSVRYSITLQTPEKYYKERAKVLDSLLATFRVFN